MKVDVAIQSYMKPESLLYTLMTLKEHSEALIDTVFINDDCSTGNIANKYSCEMVKDYFPKWQIKVRINTHRTGWGPGFILGYWPQYQSLSRFFKYGLWNLLNYRHLFYKRENIRYQWALDNTDKKYLFIIHDDIEFRKNILQEYIQFMESLVKPAIVGDLGQCWQCGYHAEPYCCDPAKIMKGDYPSPKWPLTFSYDPGKRVYRTNRACRINEWSCLVSVGAAREILQKERVFFGNYDDSGDVGAYWLDRAISLGYSFGDPFPDFEARLEYYVHGWQGHTGHSVWVDQGGGKYTYNRELILKRMKERFGAILG